MKPQIIFADEKGRHHLNDGATAERLRKAGTYDDLSTVIICPSRGVIPCRVVSSWVSLIRPMNQRVVGPLFGVGMEVGEAYNQMVEGILTHQEFSKYKYILTLEEDNIPPPDGLLKLYESIEGKVDGRKYDVVGGLYFTKGELGQPMIYGNPAVMPKNFVPQIPIPDAVQEANGLGMGFNLFRMSIFKNMKKPWFKSIQEYRHNVGTTQLSQDLYFYANAAKEGYRFGSDNRIRVGHFDQSEDIVW